MESVLYTVYYGGPIFDKFDAHYFLALSGGKGSIQSKSNLEWKLDGKNI